MDDVEFVDEFENWEANGGGAVEGMLLMLLGGNIDRGAPFGPVLGMFVGTGIG